MTTIAVYTMAAFGLAFIVGHSKISLVPRGWLATRGAVGHWLVLLAECPACCGWWTGIAAAAVAWGHTGFSRYEVALLPFYTCGANYLLGRLSGLISGDENG